MEKQIIINKLHNLLVDVNKYIDELRVIREDFEVIASEMEALMDELENEDVTKETESEIKST